MKTNFFSAAVLVMTLLTTACSNDDNEASRRSASESSAKTVLVYMAGRNDLSRAVEPDLSEIKEGSKRLGDNHNLLVFVRRYNDGSQPWLARIKNGVVTDSVSLSDMGVTSSDGEQRASDPAVMEGVMRYAFSHYPAANGNYGLVLWSHGTGWLMGKEVKPAPKRASNRAFGVDFGNYYDSNDGRWLNIPTLANVLKQLPHLKYIMFDCCCMMCLENLYELRSVADYLIGSPAEIPAQGAPYDKILPDMFGDGNFYTDIIDKYYKSVNEWLPLAAVKTSEMEQVAQATRQALQAVKAKQDSTYADMRGLIHYYYTDTKEKFDPQYNIFYDAGDFFLKHAPQDVYQQWKQALDKAVVERRNATMWSVDKDWNEYYIDFMATDRKQHCVSMFVPQDPAKGNYARYNDDIKQFEWYNVWPQ